MTSVRLLWWWFLAAGGLHGARLPDDTVPESYELSVAPADLTAANGSYAGQVTIGIRVKSTATSITLNSKRLLVHGIDVTDVATDRAVRVDSWTSDDAAERLTILIGGHVLADRKYTVRIRFEGLLRDDDDDDATGFFRRHYHTGTADAKKWLAATQFHTTHARSAFPCYDEPAFKTNFKISIRRKPNEIALSNMPISETIDVVEKVAGDSSEYRNWTWVHFARTPPISTCSVAFFVGEFERLTTCTDCQNTKNVYSHLGALYQIEYVTRAVPGLLDVLETYTNVTYSLPKLDLVAVPGPSAGSVGGWGLNAYREKSIFVDKNTKSKFIMSAKTTAERVIAYQWFGNLVTPEWWDFAWLNEGFATYFEYFGTAEVEPEWRLEHLFVIEQLQTALEYDQTIAKQRPLSAAVRAPGDLDYVFDRITRGKGAAILRMLRHWVGEESFRKALNIYLTRNRYNVVKPEHLWNAFDLARDNSTSSNLRGKSVHKIMNTWSELPGYPVVLVTKQGKSLVLTQKRFLTDSSNVNDTTKWFIRLSYTTNKIRSFDTESTLSVWLDPSTADKETGVVIPVDEDVEWYIFNIQSTGFYRVNYPEDNWVSLIKQLNDSPGAVHVLNRAQLIDDSFSLARADQLNYTVPLGLTQYLEKEVDIMPWFSAMNGLSYVLDRMRRCQRGYADVKDFVSRLAGTAFRRVEKLVAEQKSHPQYPINVGWNAFSTWACKLNNDDCTRTTLSYYRRWLNGEEIPADIKDAAFCTAVRHGGGGAGKGNWDKMLNVYQTTRTYSEKESALNALACTEDVQLLTTNLEMILDDRCPIEKHDYEAFFVALSSTPSGVTALTSFLQNHMTSIINNVKNGKNMVSTIYSILASKVSTDEETNKMSEIAFATTIPVEIRNKLSAIYNGEIKNNQNWFERNSIAIREIINPGSTTIPVTPSAAPTTQNPSKDSSNASSIFYDYATILEILVMSLSIKFFVNTD